VASVTGAVGSVTGLTASDVGAIKAKTDNLPSDPADQSLIIAATNTILADTNAVKVTTDKLDDTLEDDAGTYRFTANALEQAPSGTGASASAIADEVQTRTIAAVTVVNGLAANVITAAATAADFTTEIQSGLATAAALADVDDFLDTEIAAIKQYADRTVVRGTVSGTSPTTTTFTSSALSPAGVAADQFKGRIIVFDNDTTTTALRGQATDITASSAAANPLFTFTALTTAPQSGDTFSIL
jgi:hypothetical protein